MKKAFPTAGKASPEAADNGQNGRGPVPANWDGGREEFRPVGRQVPAALSPQGHAHHVYPVRVYGVVLCCAFDEAVDQRMPSAIPALVVSWTLRQEDKRARLLTCICEKCRR